MAFSGTTERRRLPKGLNLDCSVGGCDLRATRRGLCGKHYQKMRRRGDPLAGREYTGLTKGTCSLDGCNGKAYCKGMCQGHYCHLQQYGDPLAYKKNKCAH